MGKLGFLKDTYLRARDAARPHVHRAAALYVHPHSRRAVLRDLNLEFCSACNLRCSFCSLDSTLRAGVMSPDLLQHVLDEIADHDRYRVHVLNLHHSGDVLLHPRFPEMLERIARAKAADPRFPYVNLLTSATHLTGEKAEALLESGAADWIRFSVDGGNREDFERIRVRARWDDVLGNINAFLDAAQRRGKRLRTGLISVFDRPDPELAPEFVTLTQRVTNYMPRPPHNWIGKTDVGVPRRQVQPQGLCAFVLFQVVVLVDGRVTLCCNDLNAEGVIGDLRERSLHEIVRGPERAAVIQAMRENRRRDLAFCGTCDMT